MGEDIDWASVFAAIDNSAGVGEGGAVAPGRGEGQQLQGGGGGSAASSDQHQQPQQQQFQHHHHPQRQQHQHHRQAAPTNTVKAGPSWAVPQSPVSTPGAGNSSASNGWHDLLSQSHFRTRTPPNQTLTGDANVSPSTGNPNGVGGPSSVGPSSRPGSHRTHSLPHAAAPHVSPHDRHLSFDLTAWPWASSSASTSASANASTTASTHASPQIQAQALGLSGSFSAPGSATLPGGNTSSTEAARELNARALKRQSHSSGLALNTTTVFTNPPLSAPLPGQGQGRSNSQSSSTASTPLTQLDSLPLAPENTPDTLADNEDKRMRNTLASAKFRAKKKQHIAGVQRTISDLETQHTELQKDVVSLRQENGLLREMVQIKYGLDMKKPQ
ncbi:hypothetical protein JCM24511_05931 [Saitozyma sp. JCM 24511]|nr:hypothetical protein JCM24511_05931 [Saitozyma sp. JCM 24511]